MNMETGTLLPQKVQEIIFDSLKRGNTVELKKVNGEIVVVEIQRKVKNKTVITG
jgi:hypothetical protein